MRRGVGLAAAVLLGLGSAAGPPPVLAADPDARVVVVVGPVGDLTDSYRAYGRSAAREAARWTSDVVVVESPHATWPAVREALQGADLVVYLGHGNGFPSPHRREPWPRTQNGLGLNPIAGEGDDAHQYFGELFLARDVRLAPNAVVLLSHLCYASGNPEPGGPEPEVDEAFARADNYAAGFLAAGAQAVVADAFAPLDEYVRRLLGRAASAEAAFGAASTRRGNPIRAESQRTAGAVVVLDPETPGRGFFRSLVARGASAEAGQAVPPTGVAPVPAPPPSLAVLGVTVAPPTIESPSSGRAFVPGATARLTLPLALPEGAVLPSPMRLGVRWQPVDLDPSPNAAEEEASAAGAAPRDGPPDIPPPIVAVAAEQLAGVVSIGDAEISPAGVATEVTLPERPGLYRLTTTIHDPDDVAYDAATQALIPGLLVRVNGPLALAYGLPPSFRVEAGQHVTLRLRLANPGLLPWAEPPITFDATAGRGRRNPGPTLVARWVPLRADIADLLVTAVPAPRLEPGAETVVTVQLDAPAGAGAWLLVIDVVSPTYGSLAVATGTLGEVHVDVTRPAPPRGTRATVVAAPR